MPVNESLHRVSSQAKAQSSKVIRYPLESQSTSYATDECYNVTIRFQAI